MTTTEDRNAELVREWMEGMADGEAAYTEPLADGFTYNGDKYEPEEHWKWNYETLYKPFSDWTVSVKDTFASDDMVAVRYRYQGTHDGGDFMGISPTGKEVKGDGIALFQINNGEIAAMWKQWDSNAILEAFDILPDSEGSMIVRTQFHEVMLRVLRHNIRNDLNVILGTAESLTTGRLDPNTGGQKIQSTARDLLDTAEKVQTLESGLFTRDSVELVDVLETVRDVVAEAGDTYPTATIELTTSVTEAKLSLDPSLLDIVVREAIENAVVHATDSNPSVEVTVREPSNDAAVEITISDSGPPIPDQELKALDQAREDSLTHGSGVGLWSIQWGVDQLGGTVSFDRTESDGNTVRISLPS